jgi:YidC/Oxa1 family membrane protein insertase
MDRKSIIGILLIFLILVVFSIINKPSKEQIEAAKHRQDSIARVDAEKATALMQQQQAEEIAQEIAAATPDTLNPDLQLKEKTDQFGAFGVAAVGSEEFYTLENNLMKITFTNKGGRVYSVQLKNYQTHDSLPLMLFDGPDNRFGLNFFAQNRSIETDNFFFALEGDKKEVVVTGPEVKKGSEGRNKFNKQNPGSKESIKFKLEVAPGSFIEYVYTLEYNSFLVDLDMNLQGMSQYIASNQTFLNLKWAIEVPRQEKISKFGEDRYTNITYKFFEDETDHLSNSKSEEENLSTRLKWIGFKQLFFSSTIIADDAFPSALIKQEKTEKDPKYLASFSADITVPYEGKQTESNGMQFYFGPNHYQTLKQYNLDLERQIDLGYAVIRPVNKWLIIPVFNFLRNYIDNFGIIILLLTIIIKVILFPFTYKSYVSQAKMRVLKPEVDELNGKFGPDKAMEKQQAMMALYKKAGVNPMGGCLPMLLQMPILFAMFFFFPTSIELRQEGFLWATDLSTYDSILNLPFEIPFYGSHVSLFCLLMTITTIISTAMNQQSLNSQSMPGMKTMMYMMPIMFLFILNSYSSGLSYYYFLANVITIGQTYLMRYFVDEDKIHAQLQANKKKPVQKSNFQKRLEDMARQKGVQMPKK